MANKKKGHLTTSPEWAKHLRKYMKNQFWKGERNAEKNLIRTELNFENGEQKTAILWADFNATSDLGIRLTCQGTIEDLKSQGIELVEGMKLLLWDEDFDEHDNQDNLLVEATARFNPKKNFWEAELELSDIKHESEIRNDFSGSN
jgi:hypothetical protein